MALVIIIGVAIALGVWFYIRKGKSNNGNGGNGGVDYPNPTDPNYPNNN